MPAWCINTGGCGFTARRWGRHFRHGLAKRARTAVGAWHACALPVYV